MKHNFAKGEKGKMAIKIVVSVMIVYLVLKYAFSLMVPMLLALLLAKLIYPMGRFFQKRLRVPKAMANVSALILVVGILGTGAYFLLCTLLKQINQILKNIPVYQQLVSGYFDGICGGCDSLFQLTDGTVKGMMHTHMDSIVSFIKTKGIPMLTEQTIQMLLKTVTFIGIIGMVFFLGYLIAQQMPELKKSYENFVFYDEIHTILGPLAGAGGAYVRAQGIIMSTVALICTLGLLLLKNKYALLFGVGIAIFDAFPILGSGLILVPWAIIALVSHDVLSAAVLLTIFLACQLVRQILEPRLIGNRLGIHPICILISIYLGINLFGVPGVFLGPIAAVVISTITKEILHEAT